MDLVIPESHTPINPELINLIGKAPIMERAVDLDMKLISTRWREKFDREYPHNRLHSQEHLNRLTESIREYGYYPGRRIVVNDNPSTIDLYQLVIGLARFRAAKMAGFNYIPAIIVEETLSERQLFTMIYESDTLPEKSRVIGQFKAVRELFKAEYSRREIVDRVGIPLYHVDNYLMLDRLPKVISNMWLDQKRGSKMEPFKVTNTAIEFLYRAMMKDRRNGNFDPVGGPEYMTALRKLIKL